MICSGVNRFLPISFSFHQGKIYHTAWRDMRGAGQKPPPAQAFEQVARPAAEESGEYE